jgi:hypothetical protein
MLVIITGYGLVKQPMFKRIPASFTPCLNAAWLNSMPASIPLLYHKKGGTAITPCPELPG